MAKSNPDRPVKSTSVTLEESAMKAMKHAAIEEGMSFSRWIERLGMDYINGKLKRVA